MPTETEKFLTISLVALLLFWFFIILVKIVEILILKNSIRNIGLVNSSFSSSNVEGEIDLTDDY
jgi:hypothetical protein